jgi:hypothetical protein
VSPTPNSNHDSVALNKRAELPWVTSTPLGCPVEPDV